MCILVICFRHITIIESVDVRMNRSLSYFLQIFKLLLILSPYLLSLAHTRTLMLSHISGVGKLWPAGQMRPATGFHAAREIIYKYAYNQQRLR